jgi:hypothetical protein
MVPDTRIPTTIARVADVATLAAAATGAISQAQLDAAVPKKLYAEHECPGGIALPRPTVPPGTRVVWCMSVVPPIGGAYMQPNDKWRPTDI